MTSALWLLGLFIRLARTETRFWENGMGGVDWKQLPNLEQVYVVALVPLLFVAVPLLALIFVLWMKTRLLQKRIDVLTADLKAVFDKSRERVDSLEAGIKAIQEKNRPE